MTIAADVDAQIYTGSTTDRDAAVTAATNAVIGVAQAFGETIAAGSYTGTDAVIVNVAVRYLYALIESRKSRQQSPPDGFQPVAKLTMQEIKEIQGIIKSNITDFDRIVVNVNSPKADNQDPWYSPGWN